MADNPLAFTRRPYRRQGPTCSDVTRRSLARIAGARKADDETLLNTLLEFLRTHFDEEQLHDAGTLLFRALNRRDRCHVTLADGRDRLGFQRDGNALVLDVAGEPLTQVPLDIAIRLATLLHGTRLRTPTPSEAA